MLATFAFLLAAVATPRGVRPAYANEDDLQPKLLNAELAKELRTRAAKVKGELITVAGVGTVEVRHQQHRAYVVCDPGVPDSALIGAVSRAGRGFTAVLAER